MSILSDLAKIKIIDTKLDALTATIKTQSDYQNDVLKKILSYNHAIIKSILLGDQKATERHAETLALLNKIYRLFAPGDAAVLEMVFTNSATGETQTIKSGESVKLPRNSSVTGTIKVYDSTDVATRNETTLDGDPVITLTPGPIDPSVEMTVAGLTITLTSNAKAGAALVTVNGDAQMGDGVKPISFTADVNVPAGEAIVGEIVFSDPVDNPSVA